LGQNVIILLLLQSEKPVFIKPKEKRGSIFNWIDPLFIHRNQILSVDNLDFTATIWRLC
jgi:hypothetical protein